MAFIVVLTASDLPLFSLTDCARQLWNVALPFAGTALTRQVLRPHLATTLSALDASLPELPVGGGGDDEDSDAEEANGGGGGGGGSGGMCAVTEVLAARKKKARFRIFLLQKLFHFLGRNFLLFLTAYSFVDCKRF